MGCREIMSKETVIFVNMIAFKELVEAFQELERQQSENQVEFMAATRELVPQ